MCEWISQYDESYKCHVEPQPGSRYCIFHSPAPKDNDLFEKRFKEQLYGDGSRKGLNNRCNWTGYIFPRNLDLQQKRFEETPILLEAVIRGDLLCRGSTFKSGIYLWKARIAGSAFFDNAVLGGWEDHSGITHQRGLVIFFGTEVGDRLSLKGASFLHDTNFDGCTATSLHLGWDKPRLHGRERKGIAREVPGTGESFWRFAVRQYDKEGHRDKADAAHYFERLATWRRKLRFPPPYETEEEKRPTRRERLRQSLPRLRARAPLSFAWLADFLFLRITTAYGVSLGRLAATWLFLVSVFAGLYEYFHAFSEAGIGRAFYCSVVTFTTLGFGDVQPVGSIGRVLAGFESSLGAVTMALAVLVIGRKFMR